MPFTHRALVSLALVTAAAVTLAQPAAASGRGSPEESGGSSSAAPTPSGASTAVGRDNANLRRGDRSQAVRRLQQRLVELGYWSGRETTGVFGLLTEQAVLAFQKVERLPRTGVADDPTLRRLHVAGRPVTRSLSGDLIEIDKARQVLFVVRGGRAAWTLNTSTGTERRYRAGGRWQLADTPQGRWMVDRAIAGVRRTPLGTLYRPRYFHRDGIAIHGARDVPAWPASHGCARVTNAAMDWMWSTNVAAIGSTIWIY